LQLLQTKERILKFH